MMNEKPTIKSSFGIAGSLALASCAQPSPEAEAARVAYQVVETMPGYLCRVRNENVVYQVAIPYHVAGGGVFLDISTKNKQGREIGRIIYEDADGDGLADWRDPEPAQGNAEIDQAFYAHLVRWVVEKCQKD